MKKLIIMEKENWLAIESLEQVHIEDEERTKEHVAIGESWQE